MVVIPEGNESPPLGKHLPQTETDVSQRKSFSKTGIDLYLNATYTFSVKNRRFNVHAYSVKNRRYNGAKNN